MSVAKKEQRRNRFWDGVLITCILFLCVAAVPILDGLLQSDLDANGFTITGLEQEAVSADNTAAASTAWTQAEAIDQGWGTGSTPFTNYLAGSGFVTITGAARSGSNTINGVANAAFTNAVQAAQTNVNGYLTWVASPAATNSAGTAGMVAYSSNYLYICVTNATWRRTILSAW